MTSTPHDASADPARTRNLVLLAALTIEVVALLLWPTAHLIDRSDRPIGVGEMFIRRYELAPLLDTLKSAVDWIFPGALWSWDRLIAFTFQCLIAAFVAYGLLAWRLARAGPFRLRWVLAPLVLIQATFMFAPASLTTDIYNYAIYGEMPVLYGANPFVHTPSEFPQSPLYYLIPLYWHDAPSVYGPLWVSLSAGVAALTRPLALADELLAFRLIANAAHFLNAWLVWVLARRLDPDRAPSAVVAYAYNPLLLVDFSLNGHNDALMLTFALAGLIVGHRRRAYASAFLLGLSVATKYTSAIVAPIGLAWLAQQQPKRAAQIVCLVGGGLIVAFTVVGAYLPWLQGIETFGPVLYWITGPRINNFWPEPLLISLAAWGAGVSGQPYEAVWEPLLAGFKVTTKVGLAAFILWEMARVRAFEDVLAASARVSLVFLLLVNTWVLPWYYSWPLAFSAALGWQAPLVRVCAGLTLTSTVVMYQRQFGQAVVGEWAGLFLVLPLVMAAIPSVWRRLRRAQLGRWALPLRWPRPDLHAGRPEPPPARSKIAR